MCSFLLLFCLFLLGDSELVGRIWVGGWWEIQLKKPGKASINHMESKNFWIMRDLEGHLTQHLNTFYNLISHLIYYF